jgi:predicted nuclease of predicted toxin-antitoxin system
MDANDKLLIDECLSPDLARIAKEEFGLFAIHVPWLGTPPRGQKSWKDPDIVERVAAEDYILVTNNRKDFLGRYYAQANLQIHNGLIIVLEKTDIHGERRLFRSVIEHALVMDSTINKLIEIATDGKIRISDWPDHSLPNPWRDPFR